MPSPSVRAWVEMPSLCITSPLRLVALREGVSWNKHCRCITGCQSQVALREGVSWNLCSLEVLVCVTLSPSVRAWVEIHVAMVPQLFLSSPSVRAWVEMVFRLDQLMHFQSPSVRAWVEIVLSDKYKAFLQCRPPWGRELKYQRRYRSQYEMLSPSVRAWVEIISGFSSARPSPCRPPWGRELKCRNGCRYSSQTTVALREGVSWNAFIQRDS